MRIRTVDEAIFIENGVYFRLSGVIGWWTQDGVVYVWKGLTKFEWWRVFVYVVIGYYFVKFKRFGDKRMKGVCV